MDPFVERRQLGPLIASMPEQRWVELRAALLDILGFYALASERQKGALEFEVAVDSVTFHLLEAQAGEV